jgi:hypothetical protein
MTIPREPMFRLALASAFLLGAVSVSGTLVTTVVGKSLAPAPQSRGQAAAAIDDATAAALIGAISSQFGERAVQVRLERVDVKPAGFAQREVQGNGQLRIGHDEWIPFGFRALYDTEQAIAGSPELTLGATPPDRAEPRSGRVATSLECEIDNRLHDEFPQQFAKVDIVTVRSARVASGYISVEADGDVGFGDGAAAMHMHGLYDRRRGDWLQLAYELGSDAVSSSLAAR